MSTWLNIKQRMQRIKANRGASAYAGNDKSAEIAAMAISEEMDVIEARLDKIERVLEAHGVVE